MLSTTATTTSSLGSDLDESSQDSARRPGGLVAAIQYQHVLTSEANQAHLNEHQAARKRSLNQDLDTKYRKKLVKCVLKDDLNFLRAALSQNKYLFNIKRDKHGNNLLHVACAFGRAKSVEFLVENCVDLVDQIDDKGQTPGHIAIKNGQIEIVKYLASRTNWLENDALNNKNNGRTCVHLASKHGQSEILRHLLAEMLNKQLPIDLQDLNGNTSAHLAAKYNRLSCLQALVEFNCDLALMNRNGHTPCFVAEFYGNYECVHYLMIVETCINLSLKLVRTSKKLRQYKLSNEMLKCQMNEAICINNDFINQRDDCMQLSLQSMKKQLEQLEHKFTSQIDRVKSENKKLLDVIDELHKKRSDMRQKTPQLAFEIGQRELDLKKHIETCMEDVLSTEKKCQIIVRNDRAKMQNIMQKFDEIKLNLNQLSEDSLKSSQLSSSINSEENSEHLELLRKMYQETTHKLMIFRTALRERQALKNGTVSNRSQIVQRSNSVCSNQRATTFNQKDSNNAAVKRSQSALISNRIRLDENNETIEAIALRERKSLRPRPVQSSTPTLGNYPNAHSSEANTQRMFVENFVYNSDDANASDNQDEQRSDQTLSEHESLESLSENDRKCLNYDDSETNDLSSVATNNREAFIEQHNSKANGSQKNSQNDASVSVINRLDSNNNSKNTPNRMNQNNHSNADNSPGFYSSKNYSKITRNSLQNQIIFEEIEEYNETLNFGDSNGFKRENSNQRNTKNVDNSNIIKI